MALFVPGDRSPGHRHAIRSLCAGDAVLLAGERRRERELSRLIAGELDDEQLVHRRGKNLPAEARRADAIAQASNSLLEVQLAPIVADLARRRGEPDPKIAERLIRR